MPLHVERNIVLMCFDVVIAHICKVVNELAARTLSIGSQRLATIRKDELANVKDFDHLTGNEKVCNNESDTCLARHPETNSLYIYSCFDRKEATLILDFPRNPKT